MSDKSERSNINELIDELMKLTGKSLDEAIEKIDRLERERKERAAKEEAERRASGTNGGEHSMAITVTVDGSQTLIGRGFIDGKKVLALSGGFSPAVCQRLVAAALEEYVAAEGKI